PPAISPAPASSPASRCPPAVTPSPRRPVAPTPRRPDAPTQYGRWRLVLCTSRQRPRSGIARARTSASQEAGPGRVPWLDAGRRGRSRLGRGPVSVLVPAVVLHQHPGDHHHHEQRSEERRVGKGGRSRGGAATEKY